MRGYPEELTFWGRVGAWLTQTFPERQITVRSEARVRYFRFGRNFQVGVTAAFMIAGSWVGYATASYMLNKTIIDGKERQIETARNAYGNLLNEVSDYQRKFLSITQDLEENHALMLDLVEQNTNLQQDLSTVEYKLRMTEDEREQAFATRERLKDELSGIQSNLHSLTNRNFLLQDNLDTIETNLQRALEERNTALISGERMRREIGQLEDRLSHLQVTQLDTVGELIESTDESINNMARVVEMAGLDVADILPDLDGGQGGPFVAANASDAGDELGERLAHLEVRLNKLQHLRDRMQQVPLSPPLTTYYVTSNFGKRRDPVNQKWSMHYGLDLGGPRNSNIYTTAPGRVSFAGWKGNYGKLIEIDHGDGIKTRYGHLSKILVKKGDEVDFYDKVGLLGSTGRSTGPHVHYEVIVNGKPLNPMNFIVAGRHVFQEVETDE